MRSDYQFPKADEEPSSSKEAGHCFIERIGFQMTDMLSEPMFPPIAPMAVLVAPGTGLEGTEEALEPLTPLTMGTATAPPPEECGARVIRWLEAVLQ